MDALLGSKVYTADGKNVGQVKIVENDFFVSLKKGITLDSYYRIPVSAIHGSEPQKSTINLSLTEQQVTHGYEIKDGPPNSELVHGQSESVPMFPGKQTIHYEAAMPVEKEGGVPAWENDKLPQTTEYKCDMCNSSFSDAIFLQEHRTEAHGGPVGL